ncbi:helix-turn-helix domain-containing protein [Natrialbaceae archaeon GCM10025810]|uniref:helix-turn-helix domain-containing protein n=1 Tax=Halovalidus salilacus TaxID=3075124 RepID=UPI00360F08B5
MTSIADIEIPAAETGLGEVFEAAPSMNVEVEQVIASNGRGLWLSGPSQSEIETALAEAPAIEEHTSISRGDDRWLYDVEFGRDVVDVFDLVLDERGTVLRATASEGTWYLRIRFAERDSVSTLYDRLRENDITPTIVRLFDLTEDVHSRCGLTTRQYETLVAAIDHGYFEIPREISMQELSDELGISHQALSERLRRAYRALVTTELDVADESATTPAITSD